MPEDTPKHKSETKARFNLNRKAVPFAAFYLSSHVNPRPMPVSPDCKTGADSV